MKAERFEDLKIWQIAREQAGAIYGAIAGSAGARDFGFRDQVQRAAVSVMNNIAEGFEYRSDADFARFLDHAKGSNAEVRSMLYLAEDLEYLTAAEATPLRDQSVSLGRGIGSLLAYLRGARPSADL
jgi:four helix bundle protein